MDADYFRLGKTTTPNTVGVALSGVLLSQGVSASNTDPFYPTKGDKENADTCLAFPKTGGKYHYAMMSPCIFEGDTFGAAAGSCADDGPCSADAKAYALTGFANHMT